MSLTKTSVWHDPCPKCQGELKPIYKDVFRVKGIPMTWDKERNKIIEARPAEWLCETCKEIFNIEVVGILI